MSNPRSYYSIRLGCISVVSKYLASVTYIYEQKRRLNEKSKRAEQKRRRRYSKTPIATQKTKYYKPIYRRDKNILTVS